MKHEILIPQVGESIAEVTIAQWFKNDGDYVEAEDLICEIESDKASFEIPAEVAGFLKRGPAEGETVPVGSRVAIIDTDAVKKGNSDVSAGKDAGKTVKAEKGPDNGASPKEPARPAPAKADTSQGASYAIVVPQVGESIAEVTIAHWMKNDGDSVSEGDLVVEIESDKASFEIPAEQSGTLHIKSGEGETVPVGSTIGEISGGSAGAAPAKSEETAAAKTEEPAGKPDSRAHKISPVAAKILEEAGIHPDTVTGSGPGGLVMKEDALKAVSGKSAPEKASQAAPAAPQTPQPAPAKEESGDRQQRRERLSTLRRTIAKRLVAAKNETAMLTTFNEVDLGPVKELRARYKDVFKEKHQVGLGFMSFFTRACCIALQEWPAVNAQIDGDHVIYNDFVDISIAVSTPKGLVVPVIRNAEQLSMAGIEKEIVRLATLARDGKLSIEEMTGGTFTITNGGVFGSLMSTPIINAPQSAILGMHKIQDRPMVVDGEIRVRPMMYLALSYDHRIIDGRESVSFLVRVKELLEDPARMLLSV